MTKEEKLIIKLLEHCSLYHGDYQLLHSSDLVEMQKDWSDDDSQKHVDISKAPFWLWDYNKMIPIYDLQKDFIKNYLG